MGEGRVIFCVLVALSTLFAGAIRVAFAEEPTFFVANTRPPDAFLALRTEPSGKQGRRLMAMPNGTRLRVLERRDDGWWRVRVLASNLEGWALSGQSGKLWIACCENSPKTVDTAKALPERPAARTDLSNAGSTAKADVSPQVLTPSPPMRPAPLAPTGSNVTKVALVIGNGRYQNVGALENPPKDAAAIAKMLSAAGFQVIDAGDVGIVAMRRAVRDFSDIARDADIALVYYAGHGIEVEGINYLIPTDARLQSDFDVEDETISLDRVMRTIDGARRLRLVILDACRDNPFARSMRRSTRSVGRGLARVDPTTPDTIIAFAAKAGAVASDGDGLNSPFTAALVRHLTSPGLDIRLALGNVRDEVLAATSRKQEPFVYSSLGGRTVALVEAGTIQTSRPAGPSSGPDPAERAWIAIKDSTTTAVFEAFILRFPDSFYADVARARLGELRNLPQIALAPPPRELSSLGNEGPARAPPRHDPPPPIGLATVVPTAPTVPPPPSLEARARAFLEEYMRVSSGPESAYLALLQKVFDANVDYYGKRVTKEAILEEQRRFVARWPQRTYRLKGDAISIDCDRVRSSCSVSGDLDYVNASPAKNERSAGVWHYQFRVVLSGNEPRIVEEAGHTVTKETKPFR